MICLVLRLWHNNGRSNDSMHSTLLIYASMIYVFWEMGLLWLIRWVSYTPIILLVVYYLRYYNWISSPDMKQNWIKYLMIYRRMYGMQFWSNILLLKCWRTSEHSALSRAYTPQSYEFLCLINWPTIPEYEIRFPEIFKWPTEQSIIIINKILQVWSMGCTWF